MSIGRLGSFALVITAALPACAHIEGPPGGPEDRDPPGVLTTRPENEAVVPEYDDPVVFVFDERISERGIETAVLVSPRTSPVVVRHGRDELRVSLRQGWERDRIYHVTLGQEVFDLFGNRLEGVETLVFSTGPEIPNTTASGSVVDRLSGRRLDEVRVEAIRATDSLVYAVPTDTAGAFLIRLIPPGEYQLRAFQDANGNRSLEYFEARDSTFVQISEDVAPDVVFRLLEPDSTAPVAGTPVLDGPTIRIEFDDYLDETLVLEPASVTITSPAGDTVEVAEVTIGDPPRADAAADTLATERLPSRLLRFTLAEGVELSPETEYTITVRGLRNVNGLSTDLEVTVTTPEALVAPVAVVSPRRPSRYIGPLRARRGLAEPEPRTVRGYGGT